MQTKTQRTKAKAVQRQPSSVAWTPFPDRDARPSPQRLACESAADILGYGGAAGGGKTDLLLGLAGTEHWRSIIFRREFPRVRAVIERSREIYNATAETHVKDSYNEQLHLWRLRDGRQVEFASMQYELDKLSYQGRPHDLYGFDEGTEFSEGQIRFVIAWNRSTHINLTTRLPQRCRVVITFNPPMDETGEWITRFFLPWLAFLYPDVYQHPHPAAPGELRWYATIDDADYEVPLAQLRWYAIAGGAHREVASGAPFQEGGHWVVPVRGYEQDGVLNQARSRTFIPAALADNPILEATGYGATIDASPEPYRSLLKGMFNAAKAANPWQVVPSAWMRLAQQRWRERQQPAGLPQATGMDVARGGKAQTVLARFYGTYCAALDKHAGATTPDGPSAAALALPYAGGLAGIFVDIIGVGGSAFDSLKANGANVTGVNFAESAAGLRDRSGKLGFYNVRAAGYWLLREALDPDHGDDLALPDDPELLADLCAPTWRLTTRGVLIESKEDIEERIGRSPDCGDAVVLGHWGATQGGYEPGI